MQAIIKGTNEVVFIKPVLESDLFGCWYIVGHNIKAYDFNDLIFLEDVK